MPPPFDLLPTLLQGLGITLVITAGGGVIAIVAAFLAGLGTGYRDPIVRAFCRVYIEVFRGTSALVQLFWFYFALPVLLGVRLDAVLVAIIVLGLNIGAYGAEVVRASVEAVPAGQRLAAQALNLTRYQRMRYIIIPQSIPLMLPPFGNLMIELLKSTALVSMITVTDLTRAGLFLRDDTLRTVEIFAWLLGIYFVLSSVITLAVRKLEKIYGQSRQSQSLVTGGSR